MNISEKIFDAGVVGAGGAGFPTHIKANSNVEFVIGNGAECEPLLHKDYELMVNFASDIVNGMQLLIESTKAKKGMFGIKAKNTKAISEIEKHTNNLNIETNYLKDYYPAGDEYELVYNLTNRLIPPKGIPLDVNVVVNNVETLFNISNAYKGLPVTEKFVSVAGAVKKPSAFFVPVGTKLKDILNFVGTPDINNSAVFIGGIMMGTITFDFEEVITKTTGGIIVLPKNHYLVKRLNRNIKSMNRIGKSACDQCSYCTEFCPRGLLGYDVQPHKVMRSLSFTKSGKKLWNVFSDLCSSCGLCTLYACPEDLYPREACNQGKKYLKEKGIVFNQSKPLKVHPIRNGRNVPTKQLMKKLNIENYDYPTPFVKKFPLPKKVKIKLKQHVGAPAKPEIKLGSTVKKGDLIANIHQGNLGAKIHASLSGKVVEITDTYILIERK